MYRMVDHAFGPIAKSRTNTGRPPKAAGTNIIGVMSQDYAGAKMIILMIISMMASVTASRRASMMMLMVIVSMRMASVTPYGFDDYGINHARWSS
jgi:hypothetical protein